VVERQPRPEPGDGTPRGPAPRTDSERRRRRLIEAPANDNTMSMAQRVARAALFVVIGAAFAWLLREILG
jgi:hypothetical protein